MIVNTDLFKVVILPVCTWIEPVHLRFVAEWFQSKGDVGQTVPHAVNFTKFGSFLKMHTDLFH